MGPKSVAIIIVHYSSRSLPLTMQCLDSLHLARSSSETIYLVHRPTLSPEIFNHPTSSITKYIHQPHNLGFSGFHNLGLKQAIQDGHHYLLLLNNDTTVSPDFLPPLISALDQNNIAFVSPKIYFSPGREFHQNSYHTHELGNVIWYAGGVIDWPNIYGFHWGVNEVDHGQFDHPTTTDFATGCLMATTASIVKKIGFLDSKYFLYLEDMDWSVRAHKIGLNCLYQPKSRIWHQNAGSTGGSGSSTHVYYQTRNRIYFAKKHASNLTKAHLFLESLRALSNPTINQSLKTAHLHGWLNRLGEKKS